MLCPPEETDLNCKQRECNWLQALEGDIDTSHFSFLHTGKVEIGDIDPNHLERFQVIDRAPEYHVATTDWGTMYTRAPARGTWFHLLPFRAFRDAVLDVVSKWAAGGQCHRPGVGADG